MKSGVKANPLLLMAAATVLVFGCFDNDDLTAPEPGTVLVDIRDDFFQPDSVNLQSGGRIRWTNQGQKTHTIASDDAEWFQSDLILPTSWFELAFDSVGTFNYHCSQHDETGVVVVQ